MNKLFLILFGVVVSLSSAAGATSVEGLWRYTAHEFDGILFPVTSGLHLTFHFRSDGVVHLKWFYEGEAGFCERHADFEVIKDIWIYQKVTWVNPNNRADCSDDPDMIMGRQTMTHFHTKASQLIFELELNGKPLLYILDQVPPET